MSKSKSGKQRVKKSIRQATHPIPCRKVFKSTKDYDRKNFNGEVDDILDEELYESGSFDLFDRWKKEEKNS